ncbi:MAG: hypothetical protein WCH62_01205 [Candidatus Omnitrophota bacterium]
MRNCYVSLRTTVGGKAIFLKDCFVASFLAMTLSVIFVGCQSPQPKSTTVKTESSQEVISALGTVTQGLTQGQVSQKDLKNLAVQMQKDPQAKSAVQTINQAFNSQQGCVKYCPVDGQRFSCSLEFCPTHKVKLKNVE